MKNILEIPLTIIGFIIGILAFGLVHIMFRREEQCA